MSQNVSRFLPLFEAIDRKNSILSMHYRCVFIRVISSNLLEAIYDHKNGIYDYLLVYIRLSKIHVSKSPTLWKCPYSFRLTWDSSASLSNLPVWGTLSPKTTFSSNETCSLLWSFFKLSVSNHLLKFFNQVSFAWHWKERKGFRTTRDRRRFIILH